MKSVASTFVEPRVGQATIMRRVIWVGAGVAAAARVVQRTYRGRRKPVSNDGGLTVRATVAPELVADLSDLLRRVAGRATVDHSGTITIDLAPGVDRSEIERELRAVADRWSEMHPGVRVRVTADDERRPHRPLTRRRGVPRHEHADVVTAGSPVTPQ
jgi:hypothetical protein